MSFFFNRPSKASKMKIVIIGAGEVGLQIAGHLADEDKEVVMVDVNPEALKHAVETLDVKTVLGLGDSPVALTEAGIDGADVVLAVTDNDSTNIVASLFANKLCPTAITVARIRNEDYTRGQEDLIQDVLGINTLVNPEEEVVATIERMLAVPGVFEYNEFANGLVRMVSIQVQKGPMVGLKLSEFHTVMPNGVMVAAIERNDRIIVPSGGDVIKVGDVVSFVYLPGDLRLLHRVTDAFDEDPARNVFIVGGGNTGLRLALLLENRGYNVKLVDKDEERCAFLAETLDSTVVFRADGTDQSFLENENVGEMDAVVALTGSDEVNILICLLTKSLGVKRPIASVNKREYLPLVEAVGLSYYVNPRTAAVNSILRYIRRGKVMAAVSLGEEAEAIEVIVTEGSRITFAPLQNLGLPKGILILAIVRDNEAIIPNGGQCIQPNDRVLILVRKDNIEQVEALLTPPADE